MLQFQRSKGLFPEIEGKQDPCKDSVATSPMIQIDDHAEELKEPVSRELRGCVCHILEDTRGMNKPTCSKTAPAECGMCPQCTIKSVRIKNNKSAGYIGAVCHLPSGVEDKEQTEALRSSFYEEFNKNSAVLNRVSKMDGEEVRVNTKPAAMTTAKAIKSGRIVEESLRRTLRGSMTKKRLAEIVKDNPFKGVSVFIEFFGEDWDMIRRIAIDPAHEFYNLVKDLLALVLSLKGMAFKPNRLAEEQKMGRFKDLNNSKQAGWIVSQRTRTILSQLIKSHKLKVPNSWPKTLDYFSEDYEKIKLAEAMSFCGDRGCYFLGLTDITPDLKELMVELLRVVSSFIKKKTSRTELGISIIINCMCCYLYQCYELPYIINYYYMYDLCVLIT